MLHPSYTELMERINKDVEEGDTPIVQSRYSIVKATADRAKQIIDARSIGDKIEKQIKNEPLSEPVISDSQHLTMKKGSPLIDGNTDDMKPLSIAIEELYTGKVKISERAHTDEGEAAQEEEKADDAVNVSDETQEALTDDISDDAQDVDPDSESVEESQESTEDTEDDSEDSDDESEAADEDSEDKEDD